MHTLIKSPNEKLNDNVMSSSNPAPSKEQIYNSEGEEVILEDDKMSSSSFELNTDPRPVVNVPDGDKGPERVNMFLNMSPNYDSLKYMGQGFAIPKPPQISAHSYSTNIKHVYLFFVVFTIFAILSSLSSGINFIWHLVSLGILILSCYQLVQTSCRFRGDGSRTSPPIYIWLLIALTHYILPTFLPCVAIASYFLSKGDGEGHNPPSHTFNGVCSRPMGGRYNAGNTPPDRITSAQVGGEEGMKWKMFGTYVFISRKFGSKWSLS